MEIQNELEQLASGKVEEAQPAEGVEMIEWVFANEKNDGLRQLFHSFYSGAFQNRIGLAQCKNSETGNIETLIVGVNPIEGGGAQLFPLAVVLKETEGMVYQSPDGKGGYVGAVE